MCELLSGKLLRLFRRDGLHELPIRSVPNKRSGNELQRLPGGSVSSLHWSDELYQLSDGHVSRLNRLSIVWKLHGMPGGELLRHDRPISCERCMPRRTVLSGFLDGVLQLREWDLLRRLGLVGVHKLLDRLLSRLFRPNELHDLRLGHVFGTGRDGLFKLQCGDV